MLDLQLTIISFLSALALLFGAYATGYAVQRLAHLAGGARAASGQLFWNLFSGLLFLVSIYAIVRTGGLTILLPVPLLVFFLSKYRNSGESVKEASGSAWGFLLLTFLFHFVFYCAGLLAAGNDAMRYVSGDFNIYYRVANQMNRLAVENNILDPFYTGKPAPLPYHYGDLWLFVIIQQWIKTNPTVVLLSSVSVLSTIAVYGIRCYVVEKFNLTVTRNATIFLLALAGLFSGFAIFFPTFLFKPDIFIYSILNYPKVLLPTITIAAVLMLARNRDWTSMVLAGMAGSFMFLNLMPDMYLAMFLLLAINVFAKHISVRKAFLLTAFYGLFTALYIYLLYKVLPGSHVATASVPDPALAHAPVLSKAVYVKTAINIFIGGVFQFSTIAPYLIILLAGLLITYKSAFWRQFRTIGADTVMIVLLMFSGLFCWALLYPLTADTVQFFHNVLYPCYAIIIAVILIWTTSVIKNRVLGGLLLLLLVWAVWNNRNYIFALDEVNKKEWVEMNRFFEKDEKAPTVIYLRPAGYFNDIFRRNTLGYVAINSLTYKWPGYTSISLNAPYFTLDSTSAYYKFELETRSAAPFSRYIRQKGVSDPEQAIMGFVQDYQVRYIAIASDTLLPQILRPIAKDSLLLPKAGWTFYRL